MLYTVGGYIMTPGEFVDRSEKELLNSDPSEFSLIRNRILCDARQLFGCSSVEEIDDALPSDFKQAQSLIPSIQKATA